MVSVLRRDSESVVCFLGVINVLVVCKMLVSLLKDFGRIVDVLSLSCWMWF